MVQLWDEAERNLQEQGWVHPERRFHPRHGDNGCTLGAAEGCPHALPTRGSASDTVKHSSRKWIGCARSIATHSTA
jgi:hypothetical protein